jgi:hypothetical protein
MLIYPTLKQSPIQGLIGVGGGASGYLGRSFPYDDAAYSGFFKSGASPINIDNSSYDEYNGTVSDTQNALDFFIDHSQNKFFGGYDSASYYTWNNGGNTYSGSANFYAVDSTQNNLNGHANSSIGQNGRGCTIGYLGDGTPVIIISHTNNNRFYFFEYPNGNYIGFKTAPTGTTNNPSNTNDMTGLAWDGTRLLMMNGVNAEVFGYNLPYNTSGIDGTSIGNASRRWVVTHACHYGMAWTGDGLIISNAISSQNATYFTLSGSGLSGTSTAVRTFSLGVANYSVAIDYKNRKLVMGGYSNNRIRVWGE